MLEGIPTHLWRLVHLARRRLLMFDYDGTLAPFAVERMQARPSARTMRLLAELIASGGTHVAIVSGRPLHELEQLVHGLPATLVGEHGWDYRAPDSLPVLRRPDPAISADLDAAEAVARAAGWGEWIERKRVAVVLHTRGRETEQARMLEREFLGAWSPLATDGRLVLDEIDGGLELRAYKRNKGTAVTSLLSHAVPGTLGVFVGDDVSDEDAFEAVRDWGFGVRVGPLGDPSGAAGRLPSCDAVPAFLEAWTRIARGEGGARSLVN